MGGLPPDLNPIEQVFAKLKHFLREAAERTIDTVTAALAVVSEDVVYFFTARSV